MNPSSYLESFQISECIFYWTHIPGIFVRTKIRSMNKQIKPMAMRCNEAHFESVKQELINAGMEIMSIDNWAICIYITNNLSGVRGLVSNITPEDASSHNRTVFEEFNREILLEYCGIGVKQEPIWAPLSGSISFGSAGAKVINSLTDSNMKTISKSQLQADFIESVEAELPLETGRYDYFFINLLNEYEDKLKQVTTTTSNQSAPVKDRDYMKGLSDRVNTLPNLLSKIEKAASKGNYYIKVHGVTRETLDGLMSLGFSYDLTGGYIKFSW